MTQTTNARIAGIAFLTYIAAYMAGMALDSQAVADGAIVAKLANIGHHVLQMQLLFVCELIEAVCAIVLAVTLFSITRDEDEELALLGLLFRFGEGLLIGAFACRGTLQSLWLSTPSSTGNPSPATAETLGTYLLQAPDGGIAAILFAFGSTLFSFLLLRGRKIPVFLAWIGVGSSVLLAVTLPMQFAGFLSGRIVSFFWDSMALYEVLLALWLVIKGVPSPKMRQRQVGA
ncbi:MAG: DUF4386 domain-containing protein [Terracidiphilus sp.]